MYISMGYALFPCSQHNKKPLTTHGFKDASEARSVITIWMERHPDCAWGTPTSALHGVVDVDPRHGGDKAWASLIAQHGELPPHPITETGSGGFHHWLTFPPGTKCSQSLIGEGIDLKAEGGYVILPPSRILEPHHFQAYRWDRKPWEVPEPNAPAWLSALNTPKPKAIATSPSAPTASASAWVVEGEVPLRGHQGATQGQRRVTLLRLVGSALASGMHPEAVWLLAEEWASRCQPPFGEWEKHVAGLLRKEAEARSREPHNLLFSSPLLPYPSREERSCLAW